MALNDINSRIDRLYSAIGDSRQSDINKFSVFVRRNKRGFFMQQDFRGGLSDAQIANEAEKIISNIAVFYEHLQHWADKNMGGKQRVIATFKNSIPLKIIADLNILEKHVERNRKDHSGKEPRIAEYNRALQLAPGAMYFAEPSGRQTTHGAANVVVTGVVVDGKGSPIGDLQTIASEAVSTWELLLKDVGLIKRSS